MSAGAGGFVMVPDWLRRKRPTGIEYQAYINLGARGTWNPGSGTYDECRPSMKTLADDMGGVSESTAKRACDGLVRLGAARKTLRFNPDGSPAPSSFQLIFGKVVEPDYEEGGFTPEPTPKTDKSGVGSPVNPGGVGSGVNPPGSTGEPKVGSPVTYNQEPTTKRVLTKRDQTPPTPPPDGSRPASKRVPVQKRGGGSSNIKTQPDVAALAAELVEMAGKPRWTVAATVAVLGVLLAEGRRDWPAIELVARRAARDPGTLFPGRLVRGQIPEEWWTEAKPSKPSGRTAADCSRCDPVGWIVDTDDRPVAKCDHAPPVDNGGTASTPVPVGVSA